MAEATAAAIAPRIAPTATAVPKTADMCDLASPTRAAPFGSFLHILPTGCARRSPTPITSTMKSDHPPTQAAAVNPRTATNRAVATATRPKFTRVAGDRGRNHRHERGSRAEHCSPGRTFSPASFLDSGGIVTVQSCRSRPKRRAPSRSQPVEPSIARIAGHKSRTADARQTDRSGLVVTGSTNFQQWRRSLCHRATPPCARPRSVR